MRVLLQCAGHPAHRTLYGFCFGPISVQSVGVEACEGEIAVTRGSRAEPTRLVLRVRKVTFGGEISDLANKNGLSWPWPSQGSRSFLLGGPGSCVFRTGYPLCQAAPLPPPRPQVQVAPPPCPRHLPPGSALGLAVYLLRVPGNHLLPSQLTKPSSGLSLALHSLCGATALPQFRTGGAWPPHPVNPPHTCTQ